MPVNNSITRVFSALCRMRRGERQARLKGGQLLGILNSFSTIFSILGVYNGGVVQDYKRIESLSFEKLVALLKDIMNIVKLQVC